MKTDKFEKTIRRKLESISPEFHEDDWTKMQSYMQVHTPPGFWQQYSKWFGYAAAASVTTVMAFMYVNQLNKNNDLVSDLKNLKSRIEVIQNTPAIPAVAKTDTIYVVQKEFVPQPYFVERGYNRDQSSEYNTDQQDKGTESNVDQKRLTPETELVSAEKLTGNNAAPTVKRGTDATTDPSDGLDNPKKRIVPETDIQRNENSGVLADRETGSGREVASNGKNTTGKNLPGTGLKGSGTNNVRNYQRPYISNTLLTLREPVQTKAASEIAYSMNYALLNRISPKQVRKATQLPSPVSPQERLAEAKAAPVTQQKVNQANQTENVIPQLPIKAPYRFGGGIQFEGKNQAKSVVAEVLVGKKFSISTGVSWLKVKPMEFFTEKIFREKNKKDFKRSHPDQVPFAVDVRNINVKPTLVQIPLTVAFRNSINKDLDYYVSAGTNVTINAKEHYSFDCIPPSPGPIIFFNKSFEKKSELPLINSLNFALGIEKSWHPIVLQAEGYLYTYFTPLSPSSSKTGPGIRFKILYQIGKKM